MNWLAFALIGTASLATTAILDKFILSRYTRDATAYLISLILVQQLFALFVLASRGFEFVYPFSFIAFLAGSFQVVLWVSYLRAMQVEEVSRVTPLVFVYPLFVFGATALFLGETLTPSRYAGGVLLVLSAFLVSYKPEKAKTSLVLSPAVRYLFFFWVFVALYAVTAKYLLNFMEQKRNALGAILLEEVFDFTGRIGFLFAYSLGSVALVASVNALQPLMVLIYVIILSLFMPGILKEEITRETLVFKLSAVLLVIAGMYMIT